MGVRGAFAYDENLNLYFRSTTNRRHSQEIAVNPKVAGNIVRQVALDQPCNGAVYFEGTAEHLEPGEALQTAFACTKERLGIDGSVLEDAQRPDGNHFYKITVTNWCYFGNLEGKLQKYSLPWGK